MRRKAFGNQIVLQLGQLLLHGLVALQLNAELLVSFVVLLPHLTQICDSLLQPFHLVSPHTQIQVAVLHVDAKFGDLFVEIDDLKLVHFTRRDTVETIWAGNSKSKLENLHFLELFVTQLGVHLLQVLILGPSLLVHLLVVLAFQFGLHQLVAQVGHLILISAPFDRLEPNLSTNSILSHAPRLNNLQLIFKAGRELVEFILYKSWAWPPVSRFPIASYRAPHAEWPVVCSSWSDPPRISF